MATKKRTDAAEPDEGTGLKTLNARIPEELYRMAKMHSFLAGENMTQLVVRLMREEFARLGYTEVLQKVEALRK